MGLSENRGTQILVDHLLDTHGYPPRGMLGILFVTEHGVHAESKAMCRSPHQGDEKNFQAVSGVSVMVSLCLFPIIPHYSPLFPMKSEAKVLFEFHNRMIVLLFQFFSCACAADW